MRQLLAVLLVADRPVTQDRLCEWLADPDRPLRGSTLRTHVATLRRVLGAAGSRIHTDSTRYTIDVKPGELDLHDFKRNAAEGTEALAASDYRSAEKCLREASDSWREPALADLPDTPSLTPEIMKLTEERQLVDEALMDARLGLGEGRQLVPELRARCLADPPREQAYGQLMTALYRSGRRAEACGVYRELRRRLAETHGADPCVAVEELHQRILNDDESLLHEPFHISV